MMYVIIAGVILVGIVTLLERKFKLQVPERSENQLMAEQQMFSDIQRDTRMF